MPTNDVSAALWTNQLRHVPARKGWTDVRLGPMRLVLGRHVLECDGQQRLFSVPCWRIHATGWSAGLSEMVILLPIACRSVNVSLQYRWAVWSIPSGIGLRDLRTWTIFE